MSRYYRQKLKQWESDLFNAESKVEWVDQWVVSIIKDLKRSRYSNNKPEILFTAISFFRDCMTEDQKSDVFVALLRESSNK